MIQINNIYAHDCLDGMRSIADNSVDAIITDSPYGLGKEPKPEALLRDWLEKGYSVIKGRGFMGNEWDAFVPQPIIWKEAYRILKPGGYLLSFFGNRTYDWGALAIRLAGFEIRDCIQWIYGSGFPKSKSHLKPANEPICVARKPGPLYPLNIDECRIETNWMTDPNHRPNGKKPSQTVHCYGKDTRSEHWHQTRGRVPANVIFDESTGPLLDRQSGLLKSGAKKAGMNGAKLGYGGGGGGYELTEDWPEDIGGASRFFYCAKASPSERRDNSHPTVKPVKLMEHLVKLYCPANGICVDPYLGSGTTVIACVNTGRNYIGFENDATSFQTASTRLAKHLAIKSQQLFISVG